MPHSAILVGVAIFTSLIIGCTSPSPITPTPVPVPTRSVQQTPRVSLPSTPTPSNTTPTPVTPARVEGRVARVVNVGAIEVDVAGRTLRVRYIGVDAPRNVDQPTPLSPVDSEAMSRNVELVRGKRVTIERDVTDVDGRGYLLRYVYVDDLFVNAELIRQGHVTTSGDPPDMKHQALFQRLEAEARDGKKGLWGRPSQSTPGPARAAPIIGKQSYQVIDVREVAVNPERFRGAKAQLGGQVTDIALDPGGSGDTLIWFQARHPGGPDAYEQIQIRYRGELPRLYKNTPARAYGAFVGRVPLENAASFRIPPPLFIADFIEY